METPASARIPLPGDDVHLWRFSLRLPAGVVAQLESTLTTDELERARRFPFREHHDHYIAARGGLRAILGAYCQVDPVELRLAYGPFGKPGLAEAFGRDGIEFSLSHTREIGLLAVAQGRPVGVDLERIRDDLAYEQLARHFFSPAEVATLVSLAEEARQQAFFRCWTRKEAYLKATGEGLSMLLDSFDVSLAPGAPPALLATRPRAEEAARWTLYDVDGGEACAAALAVCGRAGRIIYQRWEPGA